LFFLNLFVAVFIWVGDQPTAKVVRLGLDISSLLVLGAEKRASQANRGGSDPALLGPFFFEKMTESSVIHSLNKKGYNLR
jgi:hypothetical protein